MSSPCQPRPPAPPITDPFGTCPVCGQRRVLIPSSDGRRLCVACRHEAQRESASAERDA